MHAAIALGSNIEPRLVYLQEARRRLLELHSGPGAVLCSKVYETSPVDCPEGSAPFLNAVVEICSDLAPEALLQRLRKIEAELGRPGNHLKNAPRTVDLDLLFCDDLTMETPCLTLPHPRMAQRRFVLQPLSDLCPDLKLPGADQTVRERLAQLKNSENISIYCNSIY